jgi:predicted alpha/beta hydrolase
LLKNIDMQPEPIKVTCADGVALAALLVALPQPRAAVMLSGGTGFKKEFYLPFAQYLAENGCAVMVYDYRGTCGSAPTDMAACTYQYLEYGTHDMPAVLDTLDTRYPHLPKYIVGHSVGAQQVGFMHNGHKVSGLLAITSGAGYVQNMTGVYRLKAWYFFKVFVPLSLRFKGYLRSKKFNIMEDLPRGVIEQWADWCSVPDYFFDGRFYGKTVPRGHFNDLPYRALVIRVADDPLATEANVHHLWKHFKSAHGIVHQVLGPSDVGGAKIDHYGFFRSKFRDTLWPVALRFLGELGE